MRREEGGDEPADRVAGLKEYGNHVGDKSIKVEGYQTGAKSRLS